MITHYSIAGVNYRKLHIRMMLSFSSPFVASVMALGPSVATLCEQRTDCTSEKLLMYYYCPSQPVLSLADLARS